MLSIEEALDRVLEDDAPMGVEAVALGEALGRVLAEDLAAPVDLPPWDNSAMDGVAVVAEDTKTPGVALKVLETIAAGDTPTREVGRGQCARIMTGAPMPQGADAVVMVEQTDGGAEQVRIHRMVQPRENVRDRGNDVSRGSRVLRTGRSLDPAAVGMLSSLGLAEVAVRIRPRVSILSTGDEIVEAGNPLGPGQIYSSNSHSLAGLVRMAGGVPLDRGNAPDEPSALQDYLQRCTDADLILTTGGVSVGDFDYVKDAMEQQGSQLDFWKVAIKPGKPLAYGRIGGVRTFGLPGNPVSCMVGFFQFVRPAIRRMLGDSHPFLPVVEARLAAPISKRPGRALFCRVSLRTIAGELQAHPLPNQSSGALSSMVDADAFALLGREEEGLAAGDKVRVQVFGGSWGGGEEPGYGW